MIKYIKLWYGGKRVEIDDGEPKFLGGIPVIQSYRTEYHWTAKLARTFVDFHNRNWQWLWGVIAAIVIAFIQG